MTFQIRDETFGLALYPGEDATDALLGFLRDRVRADLLERVELDGDVATVEYDGVRYSAVPAD